ncbi:Uu.00g032530.m01.CDS01 [Anthostomella pinea]|uniref:Uu.00g032530.m01.CDS01 n=1 Tax=Anthostomella pinea TaxID=933095 RepID=A0AAI8YD57_9PEZI|nr:Uu.00g032530.m01.CDS01 [Anthostomella pinea]
MESMAEFDDIEYEGIGKDRHVAVGSDRCFRDRSPGDTVVSLGDDGRALYLRAIPSYRESAEQQQRKAASLSSPSQSWGPFRDAESFASTATLSTGALAAMGSRPASAGSASSPIWRFRRDVQAHEQLAVGATPHHVPALDSERKSKSHDRQPATPGGLPTSKDEASVSLPSASSSRCLSVDSSGCNGTPAAELSDIHGLINPSAWQAALGDEQREHMRKVTALKRRIQPEDNPRKLKSVRLRKRDRTQVKNDQGPSS